METFCESMGVNELEVERLRDVTHLVNPDMMGLLQNFHELLTIIGTWIETSWDDSNLQGGWIVPADVPLKFSLESCEPAINEPVTSWASGHSVFILK